MLTKEQTDAEFNEVKRVEAAMYLFIETVHTLEVNGWKREEGDSENPWYWWRNPKVAQGTCTMGAALHYEHTRQDRIRPLKLVGDD